MPILQIRELRHRALTDSMVCALHHHALQQRSQGGGPWSGSLPGNLLEMGALGPHPRPGELELCRWAWQGRGAAFCGFISPPGDSPRPLPHPAPATPPRPPVEAAWLWLQSRPSGRAVDATLTPAGLWSSCRGGGWPGPGARSCAGVDPVHWRPPLPADLPCHGVVALIPLQFPPGLPPAHAHTDRPMPAQSRTAATAAAGRNDQRSLPCSVCCQ